MFFISTRPFSVTPSSSKSFPCFLLLKNVSFPGLMLSQLIEMWLSLSGLLCSWTKPSVWSSSWTGVLIPDSKQALEKFVSNPWYARMQIFVPVQVDILLPSSSSVLTSTSVTPFVNFYPVLGQRNFGAEGDAGNLAFDVVHRILQNISVCWGEGTPYMIFYHSVWPQAVRVA